MELGGSTDEELKLSLKLHEKGGATIKNVCIKLTFLVLNPWGSGFFMISFGMNQKLVSVEQISNKLCLHFFNQAWHQDIVVPFSLG